MDAQTMELVAGPLAATGVGTVCLGLISIVRQRRLSRRLRTHIVADAGAQRAAARRADPEARPQSSLVVSLQRRLSASALGAAIQTRIVRAGLSLKPGDVIIMMAVAAAVGALFGLLFFASSGSVGRLLGAL